MGWTGRTGVGVGKGRAVKPRYLVIFAARSGECAAGPPCPGSACEVGRETPRVFLCRSNLSNLSNLN
jgi:hypothetical protein